MHDGIGSAGWPSDCERSFTLVLINVPLRASRYGRIVLMAHGAGSRSSRFRVGDLRSIEV